MERSSQMQPSLHWLRWLAELLDNRFVIPGTSIRFGLDPILALVPGVGTLVSPMFAVLLLVQGVHQRVPLVVLARMLANALLDALISAVPVAGYVGDIFWRANARNLELLLRHSHPGVAPARSDFVAAAIMAGLFGLVVFVPVLLALWMLASLWWVFAGVMA